MDKLAQNAVVQAFEAIQLRDAVYVACPVSSGRRELNLMVNLSLYDRDELRTQHADRWRREVLEPNKVAAADSVTSARSQYRDRTVINPAIFDLEGHTQPHYDALCARIIESFVGHIVLADGWQYSRGARIEAVQAIERRLTVADGKGNALNPDRVMALIGEVVPSLSRMGIPESAARVLMPDLAPAAELAHA